MIASAMSRGRREDLLSARPAKVIVRSILAAMVGAVCVAGMAFAQRAPLTRADFEGRWVSKDARLTLDVSRCGKGLCGVAVTNGSCGHTALRVEEHAEDAAYQTGVVRELAGRLQLAANTEPYGVRTTLTRDDSGALTLVVSGHTGTYSPMRRTYDYNQLLVRGGDATCRPDPKLS